MFPRIMRGEGREGFFLLRCASKKVFVWDFLFTLFWSYHRWVFKPQLLSSPVLSQFVGMIGYSLVSLPGIQTVVSIIGWMNE